MDWQSLTFDWNHARAFLVTAEEGSLSAAARALHLSQPTLSRHVSNLEQELGVALFERGGKGFEVTPTGAALLQHVRAMGEAASSLTLAARSASDSEYGDICITAPELVATTLLPRLIQRLRQAEPGIAIELISTNEIVDIKRREADIAIRMVRPEQPDLIVRRLRDLTYNLYATPHYLRTLGELKTKADLSQAQFIGFNRGPQLQQILNDQGFQLKSENFSLFSANIAAYWALVKQGLGIGVMVEEVANEDPSVTAVLEGIHFPAVQPWLVTHRELNTNRRVRRVFDFLVDALG